MKHYQNKNKCNYKYKYSNIIAIIGEYYMKNKKLLAENYLYEAAARFFEEEDGTLNERSVTIIDHETGEEVEADIPDELAKTLKLASYAKMRGEDSLVGQDDVISAMEAPVAGKARAAARTADKERYSANVAAGSETFKNLIPTIKSKIQAAAKAAFDQEALVQLDDGSWYISQGAANQIQDAIFKSVIAPAIRSAGETMNNSPIRAAWEDFIGWRAAKGSKLLKLKNKIYADADKLAEEEPAETVEESCTISSSSEFAKMLNKYVNETLAYAYSTRYGVTLTEANKMFIVKDIL